MRKLLRDKRGLELKLAFYALIGLSVVIIAVGIWVNEWDTTYGTGVTYDLSEFDQLDTVSGQSNTQKDSIIVDSPGSTGESFEDTSFRGVFGLLNNIYQPFEVVFGDNGMIDAITTKVGLPDYARQAIISVMLFAITFTLAAIIFRRSQRSV